MIGLVLVTHGRLAEEMRLAMEHVVGPQQAVETVCIGPDDDLEGARAHIRDAVAHVDRGDGVAVLTDMFGGTPANLATSMQEVCKGHAVEVVAGISLPLLVKLARLRGSEPLAEAVDRAVTAGRRYMATTSELKDATLNGVKR
jgi:PTS system mannose-specific IIA component